MYYRCSFCDRFYFEVIGHSCMSKTDAKLVKKAFKSLNINLSNISFFNVDRRNGFEIRIIVEVWDL